MAGLSFCDKPAVCRGLLWRQGLGLILIDRFTPIYAGKNGINSSAEDANAPGGIMVPYYQVPSYFTFTLLDADQAE